MYGYIRTRLKRNPYTWLKELPNFGLTLEKVDGVYQKYRLRKVTNYSDKLIQKVMFELGTASEIFTKNIIGFILLLSNYLEKYYSKEEYIEFVNMMISGKIDKEDTINSIPIKKRIERMLGVILSEDGNYLEFCEDIMESLITRKGRKTIYIGFSKSNSYFRGDISDFTKLMTKYIVNLLFDTKGNNYKDSFNYEVFETISQIAGEKYLLKAYFSSNPAILWQRIKDVTGDYGFEGNIERQMEAYCSEICHPIDYKKPKSQRAIDYQIDLLQTLRRSVYFKREQELKAKYGK